MTSSCLGSKRVLAACGALLVTLGLGCAVDPLYGARPTPEADARRARARPPAPRPQVMVAGQETPPVKDPAAPPPPPAEPIDPIDAQRAVNESGFENDYLRQKERLFPDHLGQWVAIVNGRLLPTDERGRVKPAATFDECLKAAEAADDQALHRFVFRIGEEGDVVYADSSAQPRNVIGAALKSSLGIAATFDARAGDLKWTRGDKSRTFTLDHERMELLLADPAGRQSMGTRVADSAGFGGFVLLDAVTADLLDAEKFEIPGRLLLKNGSGAQGIAELHRARVRLQVRELALDELVPAGAWDR